MEKCVLAYSGGLDTSVMIPWLSEKGYEVHCVLVDVGQKEDFDKLKRNALDLGAKAVKLFPVPVSFRYYLNTVAF